MENIKLSRYYSLSDFTKSLTAEKLGIDNSPTPLHTLALSKTASLLQVICDDFCKGEKLTITSGYRSARLNAKIKNASLTSQHLKGEAVDFASKTVPHEELCHAIVNSKLDFDQIILEPSCIHISITETRRNRREYLIKTPTGYKVDTTKKGK